MSEDITCAAMTLVLVAYFTSFLSRIVFACIITATFTILICLLFASAIERSLRKRQQTMKLEEKDK